MTAVVEGIGLTQDYYIPGGMFGGAKTVRAVKGASFAVQKGKTLAIKVTGDPEAIVVVISGRLGLFIAPAPVFGAKGS